MDNRDQNVKAEVRLLQISPKQNQLLSILHSHFTLPIHEVSKLPLAPKCSNLDAHIKRSYLCPFFRSTVALPVFGSLLLERVLLLLQYALFDQRLGIRSTLQMLLQAIGAHVALEFFLVALESGCCVRIWKDVSYKKTFISSAPAAGTVRKGSRSTSSSRSGRWARPFLRLSVALWRSSSSAFACRALYSICISTLQHACSIACNDSQQRS